MPCLRSIHSLAAFMTGRLDQGLQTFLATSYIENSTIGLHYSAIPNETWAYYPDDNPQRSWYPGDSRAALVPFLAFKHLEKKDFQWLFYGDDDTLFFLNAAKHLVRDLDASKPYFLTGKPHRRYFQSSLKTPKLRSEPGMADRGFDLCSLI